MRNGLKALLISDLTQSESSKEPVDEEQEDPSEEENGDTEGADEDGNDMNKCSEGRKKNCRSEKQVTVRVFFTVTLFFNI